MKTKAKVLVMTAIMAILVIASTVVSFGCGGSWGEELVPEMLRK